MMADQKNLILAIVASVAILLAYQMFFEKPRHEQQAAQQAAQQQAKPATAQSPVEAGKSATGAPQLGVDMSGAATKPVDLVAERAAALKSVPRIRINSPDLTGSIALKGARIDDVSLKKYRVELDPHSAMVELLHPVGTSQAYYAEFGWIGEPAGKIKMPDRNTLWTADHEEVSPGNPVVLRWDNGAGLIFEQQIALDKDYMFTVTQRVRNAGTAAANLLPYGLISRTGTPETLNFYILHEGLLGVIGNTLHEIKYKDLVKDGPQRLNRPADGWALPTNTGWPRSYPIRSPMYGRASRATKSAPWKNSRPIS